MARAATERGRSGRYERKFIIAGLDPRTVEHAVRLHPAQFSEIHARRSVNNCYFDSAGLRFFWDAVQGHGNRMKVRIRWYGDFFGPVPRPVLELKGKRGPVGSKQGFPVPPFLHDRHWDLPALGVWFAGANSPAEVKGRLGALRPTLVNRYSRRYFLSADRRFRVTIDTACEYYSVLPPRDLAGRYAIDDASTIVELKYAEADDDAARNVTNRFPFRLTKSSKYVTGLRRLGFGYR